MRLIVFVFAGRQANLEIQLPYLEDILERRPEAVVHYWDLTRTPEDAAYIRQVEADREDGRIIVIDNLHPGHPVRCSVASRTMANPRRAGRRPGTKVKARPSRSCRCFIHRPPFEEPYQFYADSNNVEDNAVYIKVDDDVLFLETRRLDDLLTPLAAHPNAVVSANVINNAVCAKYADNDLDGNYGCGDPADPKNDRKWWALHTDPSFACLQHDMFLEFWRGLTEDGRPSRYVRSRPGEAISINCIAFTHATMRRLAKMFDRPAPLGDEGAVDRLLPRIASTFHAAHLTFGPQDAKMSASELDQYRQAYAAIAKEYLHG